MKHIPPTVGVTQSIQSFQSEMNSDQKFPSSKPIYSGNELIYGLFIILLIGLIILI